MSEVSQSSKYEDLQDNGSTPFIPTVEDVPVDTTHRHRRVKSTVPSEPTKAHPPTPDDTGFTALDTNPPLSGFGRFPHFNIPHEWGDRLEQELDESTVDFHRRVTRYFMSRQQYFSDRPVDVIEPSVVEINLLRYGPLRYRSNEWPYNESSFDEMRIVNRLNALYFGYSHFVDGQTLISGVGGWLDRIETFINHNPFLKRPLFLHWCLWREDIAFHRLNLASSQAEFYHMFDIFIRCVKLGWPFTVHSDPLDNVRNFYKPRV